MLLKKLVIAEDDDAVAHLLAAWLGDAGFLCLRAHDGEQALYLVRGELPDLLVLDLMMPKLDGMEVCKRLKSDVLLSRVPILMLSARDSIEDRVNGLDAGADDYMSKPFDIRELAARVRALIRQSRRERDRNAITNLPGSESIEDELNRRLERDESFALLYLDIEQFSGYSEIYGFQRGEEVIATMGQVILERSRASTGEGSFIGHIGGDDFIIICSASKAEVCRDEVETACRKKVPDFYNKEDREMGYIRPRTAAGKPEEPIPFMNPSIAMLNVKPGQFKEAAALASQLTRVKATTRSVTRSGVFRALEEG